MIERTTKGRDAVDDRGSQVRMFDQVVAQHTGLISRIALAHEADPALRRDLTQDIMLAIWGSLPRFRRESSLKTFVAGVAYKRSIAHVARAVRRPKPSQLSEHLVCKDPLPDEMAARNQLKARMLDVIQSLPIAQKQAIILCLDDFTFEEIGATLGISTRAATMRCHRARTALKAAIENWS